MVVVHDNLASQNVDDVRIVPNCFGGKFRAGTDLQTIGAIVIEPVQSNQRPTVISELTEDVSRARRSSKIPQGFVG